MRDGLAAPNGLRLSSERSEASLLQPRVRRNGSKLPSAVAGANREHAARTIPYWITRSARLSTCGGIVTLTSRAVFRFTISS